MVWVCGGAGGQRIFVGDSQSSMPKIRSAESECFDARQTWEFPKIGDPNLVL